MIDNIQNFILEFCNLNKNYLIIGGYDKLLQGKNPRDIDLYTSLNKDEAQTQIREYLNKKSLIFYEQVSPYDILQYYIIEEKNAKIILLDVLFSKKSLRCRQYFMRDDFILKPKILDISHFKIYYDENLIFIKNVYKPYVVGDLKKYVSNKIRFEQVFGKPITENAHGELFLGERLVSLEKRTARWLYVSFIEKVINIFIVNLLNIIIVQNEPTVLAKMKNLKGEIDLRIICRGDDKSSFRQCRKFLFFEVPISALKLTIIKIKIPFVVRPACIAFFNRKLNIFIKALK